ncbi:unnamed protein product, partial [Amoebophrya sp. A25]|eukprot:GSA25T00018166001.1
MIVVDDETATRTPRTHASCHQKHKLSECDIMDRCIMVAKVQHYWTSFCYNCYSTVKVNRIILWFFQPTKIIW